MFLMKDESEKVRPGKCERDSVTPEFLFLNRRRFMQASALALSAAAMPLPLRAAKSFFPAKANEKYKISDPLTKESIATSYNNFYEFSLEKGEVKEKAEKWAIANPWKVEIGGLAGDKKTRTVEELIDLAGGSVEERIYRFRCVEAWSMVVPWSGFPLAKLIEKLKPQKGAKYVKFTTFGDKAVGPNIGKMPHYPWPYTEGLTIEEAMHPLTLLATGMYGKPLPKQNGAPIRLIVPWKYGFKSIKSIVKIELTAEQPKTLWSALAPDEYGFYANVNPKVDHPRWSQASERILDDSFFPKRKPTLMFNGYESEVAALYKGLDLKKFY
jgi:sulfoxide reductase catalytic subunit YedY